MYCNSLSKYSRRETVQTTIGDLHIGSNFPIRVQSMTTVDTMDTIGSVEQTIRMIESGCELVRITAPSVKEAQNLENIKKELRKRGYNTPLVADIHFTPNAAELAARIVEKVRINPGNYADKKRFEVIDYTDQSYQSELQRIRDRFLPLVNICKEYGTAMRIGTNHGSLSDRILSRYGDTPLGMVESALEFLKICEAENYHNIIISMKSSNTQVMVEAYRMLVNRLNTDGLKPYPLHLGVTEAGEGEDGRIKSAVGIGTLLEDGLGDTVRVSLTEDPEFEAPVAKTLVSRYDSRINLKEEFIEEPYCINPYQYSKRYSTELENFGGKQVPRVIADFSNFDIKEMDDLKPVGHFFLPVPDKWRMNDLGVDYIYTGSKTIPFMLPNGLKQIIDFEVWIDIESKSHVFPLLSKTLYLENYLNLKSLNFLKITTSELDQNLLSKIKDTKATVVILNSLNESKMIDLRNTFFKFINQKINTPVIISSEYSEESLSDFQLYSATDIGALLIDGLGDGLMLSNRKNSSNEKAKSDLKNSNNTAFGILQAARTRMSKTEYISCPSCGRTLFDLQETTAMIRKKTDHLKGIKIGIMGCIVNGPGEMADADYGYVGIGKDKISLYRGQEVVKKSVHSDNAVDELIDLIKEDGNWIEVDNEMEHLKN
jgi:(E)-4-hydroxy-3-methylbut-2-enyl-diphosphate synthase